MDWTKAGIHAYDFLTSWDQASVWAKADGVPYLPDTSTGSGLNAHANDSLPNGSTLLHVSGNTDFVDVPIPNDPYVDTTDGSTSTRFMAYQTSSTTAGLPG